MFVVQQASLGDAETQVLMFSQVFNNATDEGASFLQYDAEECESGLDAFFHDMSNTERKGNWLRTWWGSVLLPIRLRCMLILITHLSLASKQRAASIDLTAGSSARRVNMGTADELAVDVLINALSNFSRECVNGLPCR